MATFSAYEINSTEVDIMGPLKDKKNAVNN